METAPQIIMEVAAQLGVAVEYLWPLLVQHMRVNATVHLVAGLLLLATGIAILREVSRSWQDAKWGSDTPWRFFAAMAGIGAGILGVAVIGSSITPLLVPEAQVIYQLLDRVRR